MHKHACKSILWAITSIIKYFLFSTLAIPQKEALAIKQSGQTEKHMFSVS